MATETELKIVLPQFDDYARVRTALDAMVTAHGVEPIEVPQVNYYLDTVGRQLLQQKAMARVRVAGGQVELTVKVKPKLVDGVIHVSEYQDFLPSALANVWLTNPPPRTDLSLDTHGWLQSPAILPAPLPPDAQLLVLGAMNNVRRKYAVNASDFGGDTATLVVELDRVHYGMGEHEAERFEIEIETPQAAQLLPFVEAWLEHLGVDFCRATETKYAQFLRLSAQF